MALPSYYVQMLGTEMYPKVHATYPDISVKLTNMLLQLPFVQVIQLYVSSFARKVAVI